MIKINTELDSLSKPSTIVLDPLGESERFNPMDFSTPGYFISMLEAGIQEKLTETQRERAINIVSNLPDGATILDFIRSGEKESIIRSFALKVGSNFLGISKYSHIFNNDT